MAWCRQATSHCLNQYCPVLCRYMATLDPNYLISFHDTKTSLISTLTTTRKFPFHTNRTTLIARFMGPTWGPSGADRTQVGPMLAPWTLLSGYGCWLWCRGEVPRVFPVDLVKHFVKWRLISENIFKLINRQTTLNGFSNFLMYRVRLDGQSPLCIIVSIRAVKICFGARHTRDRH